MTVYDALRPATQFPPETYMYDSILVSHLPGQHEQEQRHAQVRCRGVHPDAKRQWVQEPEQLRFLLLRFRVQYAYAQRHERRRKVYRVPPVKSDRKITDG